MSGSRAVFEDLRKLFAEAAREELPDLIGDLEAEKARAIVLLTAPSSGNGHPPAEEPEPWLTPAAAAAIAGLPVATPGDSQRSVRRIYEWARGQKWASRPSRKCLRISEGAFRRWLASRRSA
jgi:hypothetical protein